MSDQSDAPVSTEPSDHVVTIPPELPDDDMDLDSWDHFCMNFHLLEPRANQREYHAHAFSLLNMAPERDPFWMNFDLLESQATRGDPLWMNFDLPASRANQSEHDEDEDTPASPGLRFSRRFWDTWMQSDLLESQANQSTDPFCMNFHLPESRANQRDAFGLNVDLRASQANQREHILMNSWANPVSFRQALQRVHQAHRSVELTIGQVRRLESCVLSFEDFDSLALPRQQTREVWYDGWNRYGRPGDKYTVIGLISTISCAIYSILFGLTGQMYKEEDGSFFSHHRVMVTISMLSMVYAAFSGVFLCVIYYLATADPTHTYRRRMRFLSGTFVSAACFGPAVMFMAMFVGPLGFKMFAWAVLGAALTWVGFYIGG